MTAIALTIAGSDSSGGAGIQADLKTFSALGVYGASVITALTAQNTLGVQGIHNAPPSFVVQQIQSVLSDLDVRAIKIGMLSNTAIIKAVAGVLAMHRHIPVVLDPVMVAASGDALLEADAIVALRTCLLPLAAIITPNLPEASLLCGLPVARHEDQVIEQGRQLLAQGASSVLVKGGHAEGAESTDVLIAPGLLRRYSAPRIATRNVHGTGCTLSSAIAAGLAKGLPLVEAVAVAKTYITAAIAASSELAVGKGHGPAHHFHAFWR
jgi:hydroxymethylpyrimidine/phosphomethylpyrimidine kinase